MLMGTESMKLFRGDNLSGYGMGGSMTNTYGYDELCRIIESCVVETDYKTVSSCKNLLMVAVNEERWLKRCVEGLLGQRPEMKITFIAQPIMEPILKKWYGQHTVIEWKGKYTVNVVRALENNEQSSKPEGFFYFTEQPVNLRDENLMKIAEVLQESAGIRVFSSTIGDDLYEYHNISLYRRAISIYEETNQMIDHLA